MIKKVAIVIPWFGRELKGGAEQQAWQVATRLSKRNVELTVLSTCSKEFLSDWSINYYTPGEYNEDNIRVIRFSVLRRDPQLFQTINSKLLSLDRKKLIPGISPLNNMEERIYLQENINSPNLIQYIRDNYPHYDHFLFLPYLFPSSINGIEAAKNKGILQPCLHDECYAYLECIRQMVDRAAGLLFISEGEFELALKLYGDTIKRKSRIVGGGVEIDPALYEEYSSPPTIDGDYLLYLGRREVGKNTDLLIESFEAFVDETKSNTKLVLAGPGNLPISPKKEQIIDLKLVSEETKLNLIKYCKALVNPSMNESFSRVVFEAWCLRKPVIVNRNCLATYRAFKTSGFAGWCGDSKESFIEIFEIVDRTTHAQLKILGDRGYKYAKGVADWDMVIDKYVEAFDSLEGPNEQVIIKDRQESDVRHRAGKPKVLIMYSHITDGDAVGIDVLQEYLALKENGLDAHVYADTFEDYLSPYMIPEIELNKIITGNDASVIIYHHANYWERGEYLLKGAKVKVFMKYHNITLPDFFRKYDGVTSVLCEKGRVQTERLIKSGIFSHFIADSEYNARELYRYGAPREKVSILPPFHKIEEFRNVTLNIHLVTKLTADSTINVLFVGRMAPNKGHKHLVETIREYTQLYDNKIRLIIVGGQDPRLSNYQSEITKLISLYNLSDIVSLTNRVTFEDLYTYYATADIFLLMSEHEGFCVPILEAQYNKVPIIALNRCAVKETIGAEQIVLDDPDYSLFAGSIRTVVTDQEIKNYLVKKGYENYLKYEKHRLSEKLIKFINNFL
jgi:glycosyltransferase involved in cell wall biosynthesis